MRQVLKKMRKITKTYQKSCSRICLLNLFNPFRKNQIETQFLSFESNQKKSDKTLNESLPQPLEDLKQKNSKLTKNLKEETYKKTQTLSKFNEIIAKYEEVLPNTLNYLNNLIDFSGMQTNPGKISQKR